ncbi:MAG: ORF6N domain-containing protein [Bacteroidia bacterium]
MEKDKSFSSIENLIYSIRSKQVMIDKDLAMIYGIETKVLNQAVKRNFMRFPESFRFQLTDEEYWRCSRSQIVTLNISESALKLKRGENLKYKPYAFTEQGVAMLSAVLKSETAIQLSIQIMDAFVKMRKVIQDQSGLYQRLNRVESKQIEADSKFEKIFKALEDKNQIPLKGLFFEGQIFDAYVLLTKIIQSAQSSIILIDNYMDETVLTMLNNKNKAVRVELFTSNISKEFLLAFKKFEAQNPKTQLNKLTKSHDRFMIIDGRELYHFGASLKDLGKKWFAFSRLDDLVEEVLFKLKLQNNADDSR